MTDFQKEVLMLTNNSPDVTMGAIIHAAERFGMKDEEALYPLTNDPPYNNIIAFFGINEDAVKELSELSIGNTFRFRLRLMHYLVKYMNRQKKTTDITTFHQTAEPV